MCEHAVLGPVDPQIGEYPAASIVKAVREKPIERIDDRTLILADTAEKAINQTREAVQEILTGRYPDDKAEELARILTEGRWTHDYPITYREAKELGLNVSAEMPREILELIRLYPQPVRHDQGVEYLPTPRHRKE
jgi:ClpP class serine protease